MINQNQFPQVSLEIELKLYKVYKSSHLKLHLLRSLINLPMMLLGFGALVFIPLEQIQALHFIVPLIVTSLGTVLVLSILYPK